MSVGGKMNYKKQLVRFKIDKITELSLLLFVVSFIVSTAINLLALKRPLLITNKVYFDIMIVVGIYLLGLPVHEILHALGAIIFAGKKKSEISFGMHLKQMMLYCHINTPMKNSAYRGLLLLPVIVTGIIPLIISTFLGNIFLTLVFSLLVSGGAGDFIMFKSLLKHDKNSLILDHAEAPAYYLIYPENELPADFSEVTEDEESSLKEEMNTPQKSSRSNTLKIFAILIFFVLAVLGVFLAALLMKLF